MVSAWLYGVHRTRRNGSSFTWHQPCNKRTALLSTPLRWKFKTLFKKIECTCDKSAVSLLESGEQRNVKLEVSVTTLNNNVLTDRCVCRAFFHSFLNLERIRFSSSVSEPRETLGLLSLRSSVVAVTETRQTERCVQKTQTSWTSPTTSSTSRWRYVC